ncbi:MAG: CoA transferase [Dehalococcoidales bacterium]|nr:CoA transferase [Dehalococcoidales bacterium]
MLDSLLSGFRALDLTDEKGFACGKILAMLGVDVIKVEKPGGDAARLIPPFMQNVPDPEQSLYWMSYHTDKRGITLNLGSSQGKDLFKKLVEKADFVLESFPPGYMDMLGLGYEALSQINKRIVMTSITPFGQKGPYSQYKGSNLVAQAMSGVLENTGYPDRAPVQEAPDTVYFETGVAAALGTLISHYYREISGEGQQVDVSLHERAASRMRDCLVTYFFEDKLVKRTAVSGHAIGVRPQRWLWSCKDGDIFWRGDPNMLPSGKQVMSEWFDEAGLDNPFHSEEKVSLDTFDAMVVPLFLKYTKKEIMERFWKTENQAWPVSNSAEVLESPQNNAREFFKKLEHPKSDVTLAYPRHMFLSNETENYVKRSAPLIGEHNDEIYEKELGLSTAEIDGLKKTGVI